jgi:glycosyltransferase involved in cell wall biosynthesis
MKLCFLAAADNIHSYRWIHYFASHGHEVAWISLVPGSFVRIPGVHYHELAHSHDPLAVLGAVPAIRAVLHDFQPDALHVHSVGSYGVAGLLAGYSPLIATPWGSDVIYGKHSPIKRWFIRRVLQRAGLITCDAEHMRDEIAALGVDAGKARIINFGIDTGRFRPRGPSPAIRAKLDLGEAPTVISLRNFDPVYDIPSLLHAMPQVLAQRPDARFVIVGRGPLEAELKALGHALGIMDQVRFVGFVPNVELPDYLSAMDVYVSTSLSDAGIAASTAEAMACAVPVVITDSGENARWIESGGNGFLVPVSDPRALAEMLLRLIADPELRSRLGAAGRATIQQRNDYQVEMAKMEALYQQIGGTRP